MAESREDHDPANESGVDPDQALESFRREIDEVDRELVVLLNRRAAISQQVGHVKERLGLEIWSPAREEAVLDAVAALNDGPMPQHSLRLIFRELFSTSRALQKPMRVAFLGPHFSYSHMASVAKFGRSVEHVPVTTIAAVFEEVHRRHVQFGLVPLENSTDGRIADTLDMFTKLTAMRIRAEVRLRIHHNLMGRCEWAQVRTVYSKAQALSQCRNWLSKNLPSASMVESVSTAEAAQRAAEEPDAAAVAALPAAENYGLRILATNIEDNPYNITRFAVISEQTERPTGADKTTLMARVSNRRGALKQILEPLSYNNMTWIESFPTPEAGPDDDPSYLFFIDIEGHCEDTEIKLSIDRARQACERLEVLGSYPRSVCIDY